MFCTVPRNHAVRTAQAPEAEVWRLIRAVSHTPDAMAACHQIAVDSGLPLAPLRALLVLPLDEPVTMRELARRLGCDNSYVTSLVDALEKRGLAGREQHPTDRRVKVIVLTGQGRDLAERAQIADAAAPAVFDRLTEQELVTLRDLLAKLLP
ncbi:MarR family winged helix-turn-helix transcriptional regulator [Flexivirga caeni]|uniref:MarR family transcriptional regulator n=1 Tax=Flexivirga caeni TaxID=2294115 RepID=A0A3M9MGQ4_9MICO|nr:MarR family transcriptional regulator [Flexivirga caeni]RNI24375.1 MarR family transcriptional regulator [Flexivirga caeni]